MNLSPLPGEYCILDDQDEKVEIKGLQDENGIVYWYRKLKTPVCLTGECKLIEIGIYWDCTGSFRGLEVYGEHLTKTDHSDFSQQDYDQLMSILQNDWSILREYELSELVDDPYADAEVDGATGATKKEIADEAVDDAVYTTYTIWHLIHVGEKEQLAALTLTELKSDDELMSKLLKSSKKEYSYFLLDLLAQGKLSPSPLTDSLVIKGLNTEDDPHLSTLVSQSLAKSNVNSTFIQTELAKIYHHAPMNEKLQILSALKDINTIDQSLYDALSEDMDMENEWFLLKILEVLKSASHHSDKVIITAQQLTKSENSLLRQSATELLTRVD
ncbi:hypothetical protein WJR50_17765 [Catalinimonas sp. 4WD22]|uniref:hypothetical protein n=1 Tax=Catalinimonas locisalis TaxID=3133978 RepID=UPI003100CBA8